MLREWAKLEGHWTWAAVEGIADLHTFTSRSGEHLNLTIALLGGGYVIHFHPTFSPSPLKRDAMVLHYMTVVVLFSRAEKIANVAGAKRLPS